MCAVPDMAVFCSSLNSCFSPLLLTYFLNDFEIVPLAPIITGITFVFTFHMRCISIVYYYYYYYYYCVQGQCTCYLLLFTSRCLAQPLKLVLPINVKFQASQPKLTMSLQLSKAACLETFTFSLSSP